MVSQEKNKTTNKRITGAGGGVADDGIDGAGETRIIPTVI